MRKIGKLTAGLLAVVTLGLTSCVDNELTPEVKQIYANQASILDAKSKIELAEAGIKAEELKIKVLATKLAAAKTEADIAEQNRLLQVAKNSLELAIEQHKVVIANAVKAAKEVGNTHTLEYLDKYITEFGVVNGKKRTLANKEAELVRRKADKEVYITKDKQVEVQAFRVKEAELALEMNKKSLADLEAILADPANLEAKALALTKEREDLKKANDALQREIDQLTADKNDLGTEINNYASAEGALNGAKATLVALEKELVVLEATKVEKETELGSATITYEVAVSNQIDAQKEVNKKNDEVVRLTNLVTEYNNFVTTTLHPLRSAEATIDEAITNATAAEATAKGNYEAAEAVHNTNPNGNTATINPDAVQGNLDDALPNTYRKITSLTGGAGTPPYQFAPSPVYHTAAEVTAAGGVVGTAVGNYYDVEADDSGIVTNEAHLQTTYASWKNAKNALADLKAQKVTLVADLAKAEAKNTEYYGDVDTKLTVAQQELNQANTNLTKANDALNLLSTIVTVKEGIVAKKKQIEEAKAEVDKKLAKFTALQGKVSDTELAKYNALIDSINAKQEEKNLNDIKRNHLLQDITSYNATSLYMNGTGDDYAEVVRRLKVDIEAKKEANVTLAANIKLAQNNLEKIKVGEPIANYEAQTKELELEIAKLKADIAAREKLVEKYKKLYEDSLA